MTGQPPHVYERRGRAQSWLARGNQLRVRMAARADGLRGPTRDAKLRMVSDEVRKLLADGFNPIVFCRFIATAEYVAEELEKVLPKGVAVQAVTGTLPPYEREVRVAALGGNPKRVLVATDCLSEGVNLQEHFDAVIHYDLAWNPTRHEQREGRVDRFGQPSDIVRAVTLFGTDTRIDGIVLDVLIRKHKNIRSSLGFSVSVPIGTEQVLEAIFEGLLLREDVGSAQGHLPGFEELLRDQKTRVDRAYDEAAARETKSRSRFAQHSIRVDDVQRELDVSRGARRQATGYARVSGPPGTGRTMKNEAPASGSVATAMEPPWLRTAPRTDASPRPCPEGFVVKNGSKILAMVSLSIPGPSSLTSRTM